MIAGNIVSVTEVMERWAWTELTSPAFSHVYNAFGAGPMIAHKVRGGCFDHLTSAHRLILRQLHAQVRGSLCLYWDGVAHFTKELWPKDRVGSQWGMKGNAQDAARRIRMDDFARWGAGNGWLRTEAEAGEIEPITFGIDLEDGALILVDGFHRVVQFLEGPKLKDQLAVFVPKAPSPFVGGRS